MTLNGLISFALKKIHPETGDLDLIAVQRDRPDEEPKLGTLGFDGAAKPGGSDSPTPALDVLSIESAPSDSAGNGDDDWVSGVMDELLENDEPSDPEIAQLADGLEKIDVAELAASCDEVMRSLEARFAIRGHRRHGNPASSR